MVDDIFSVFEDAPFIFHMLDENGVILNVSNGWLDFLGYDREEVIGTIAVNFLTEDSRIYALEEGLPTLFKNGTNNNVYYQAVKKDGTIADILISAVVHVVDGKTVTYSFTTDITEQKKIEKQLKRSNQRLAEVQRIAHLGNWEWDINKDSVYWSDEAYMIYCGSKITEPLTYNTFINVVHPDDREYVSNSVDNALSDYELYDIEHRVVLPDNDIRIVHAKGKVIFTNDGVPYKMIGTVYDITNRRKNELMLERYREHLEDLVEERTKEFNEALEMYKTLARISPVGIMRTDSNGDCAFVNNTWRDLTGMNKEECKDRGWIDAIHKDDKECVMESWNKCVNEKTNCSAEFRIVDKNNNILWMLFQANVVNGGNCGHVVTFTDITGKKELLPQLLDLQQTLRQEYNKGRDNNGY